MPNANLYFKFVDSTSKAGKTGLTVTANVCKLTKSGTKTTVATGASCAEVGGGIYAYNLSSPDFSTYDYVATATPSDTTGLANADADAMWADFAPDVQARVPSALTTDGNIKADALRLGGTVQTGRDIGASVLLSSGTGTGQISLTSGKVAGVALVDTVTTLTGHTPQTGDTYTRIGAAGAGLTALGDARLANLDATVGSRMASYTQPTGFLTATFSGTVASTTNITAGTITTATNLTNLPTAPTDWLTAAAVKADAATKITTAVWVANPAGFTSGSIGYTLNNRITSIKTKTDALSDTPAADVWEILTADHSTTGTFGAAMAAAGTAGDPWTTPLPGAYGPGTAGYIIGHSSSGVTVDLSAVLSAQAIAQAALVRIQAAVYDTARVSGNVIFMSDGHTQRLTAGGRQTV